MAGLNDPETGVVLGEAEDIITSGYVMDSPSAPSPNAENPNAETRAFASGDALVSLQPSGEALGALAYTFNGDAGRYRLAITTQDEHDGESTIRLRVDGVLKAEFVMDQMSAPDPEGGAHWVTIHLEGLDLSPGAEVEVSVMQHGAEAGRIDKLEFFAEGASAPRSELPPSALSEPAPPVLEAFSVEAEELIATGFDRDAASSASDNVVPFLVPTQPSSGTLSYSYDGQSGAFDLKIAAHDAHIGQSQIEVRLNGVLLERFNFDQTGLGGGVVPHANPAELLVENVELCAGDELVIHALQDGELSMWIDKIEFDPLDDDPVSEQAPDLDEADGFYALSALDESPIYAAPGVETVDARGTQGANDNASSGDDSVSDLSENDIFQTSSTPNDDDFLG